MKKYLIYSWLSFCFLYFFIHANNAWGQSNKIPLNGQDIEDIERWESLNKRFYDATLAQKSWMQEELSKEFKIQANRIQSVYASQNEDNLSKIDEYNQQKFKEQHGIWFENSVGMPETPLSKKPILKYFYRTPFNFFDVYEEDIFLAVNPVLGLELAYDVEKNNLKYENFRGIELKGNLFNKVGFYTKLGDYQRKVGDYTDDYFIENQSLPGFDYARRIGDNKYDIFLASAYIQAKIYKNYITASAGFDHQFIGYGMRSLVLGNEGAPHTFLHLQGRWNKFSYDFLYLELIGDYRLAGDQVLPKKYAQIHQLNFDIHPRVRLGIFEKSILAENRKFNPLQVLPIPGIQSIINDESIQSEFGFQAKGNLAKGLNVYTQGFIKNLTINKSFWDYANQWALQLGVQYYNVLGLKNLDVQGEINWLRPFAYSAHEKGLNYTHYNQPLAHPFGEGFVETLGKVRYQFHPKWNLYIIGSISKKSINVSNLNEYLGIDPKEILEDYSKIPYDTEVQNWIQDWDNPNARYFLYAKAWIDYEWKPNIRLRLGGFHRQFADKDSNYIYKQNNSTFIGLNWNFIPRNLIY